MHGNAVSIVDVVSHLSKTAMDNLKAYNKRNEAARAALNVSGEQHGAATASGEQHGDAKASGEQHGDAKASPKRAGDDECEQHGDAKASAKRRRKQ